MKGIQIAMNLALYQAIQNELSMRAKGETGTLFKNQTTEQLNKLKVNYEKEIFQYMSIKITNHISKFERCVSV